MLFPLLDRKYAYLACLSRDMRKSKEILIKIYEFFVLDLGGLKINMKSICKSRYP